MLRLRPIPVGIVFLVMALAGAAFSAEPVLVLSSGSPEYQAVAVGFKNAFPGTSREINLDGNDLKLKAVGEQLKASPPALAVVVGDQAAQMAKWYLEGVPVIYCDAIRAAKISLTTGKTVGIYHEADPAEQLKLLPALFAGKTRVVLLYCPEYSRINPNAIQQQAQGMGLTLEVLALATIQEVPVKLREVMPRADLLWVFTDPVVLSSHSIQYLVMQAITAGKPIFCGDLALARHGAAAAVVPDWQNAGQQAALEATNLLKGGGHAFGTTLYPKGKLILNQRIAGLMKISFSAALIGQAQELIQ